jgi:hypothetical protein
MLKSIEALATTTVLSIADIDKLAKRFANKTLGRSSDKIKSVKRLEKELSVRLGKEDPSSEIEKILKAPGMEVASGVVHALLDDDPKPSKAKAPKVAKEKKPRAPKGEPRKTKFAGKTLTAKVDENPRRTGSFGFKSMKIIMDNPGITFEDFLKKGGRAKDLAWDVDAGSVTVKG